MIAGFISDAHGNVGALATGLRELRKRGAEKVFFLGDSVGYLPGTAALDLVMKEGLSAIRGNHEEMCLGERGKGDNADVYRLPDPRELNAEVRDFLTRLPTQRRLEDGDLLMVHGSPLDPTFGYVYPNTDLAELSDHARIVVMGHTHRPFVKEQAGTTFVNCGSCAFPRDGVADGAAALVDTQSARAEVVRFTINDTIVEALQRTDLHPLTRRALERLRKN